jgi:TPR repeat protein
LEWYEKSAKAGYCHAMNNVGVCYKRGKGGVTIDLNKAREWYTKSAAQGSTRAQTALDKLNAQ